MYGLLILLGRCLISVSKQQKGSLTNEISRNDERIEASAALLENIYSFANSHR